MHRCAIAAHLYSLFTLNYHVFLLHVLRLFDLLLRVERRAEDEYTE
jgi:hypothetical protein